MRVYGCVAVAKNPYAGVYAGAKKYAARAAQKNIGRNGAPKEHKTAKIFFVFLERRSYLVTRKNTGHTRVWVYTSCTQWLFSAAPGTNLIISSKAIN